MVVPSNEVIKITTAEGESNEFNLIADGADSIDVSNEVLIEKAEQKAYLALLQDEEFYSVLRDKLHWGVSPRSL